MDIRKATKKDLPSLIKLSQKLQDYESQFDKTLKPNVEKESGKIFKKEMKSKDTVFFIAEHKNKPIGYCYGKVQKAHPYREYEKEGFYSDCFVEKQYRKKGVGKALTEELFSWFKEKGVESVKLNTLARNPARFAWKKLGFEPEGLRLKISLKKTKKSQK